MSSPHQDYLGEVIAPTFQFRNCIQGVPSPRTPTFIVRVIIVVLWRGTEFRRVELLWHATNTEALRLPLRHVEFKVVTCVRVCVLPTLYRIVKALLNW